MNAEEIITKLNNSEIIEGAEDCIFADYIVTNNQYDLIDKYLYKMPNRERFIVLIISYCFDRSNKAFLKKLCIDYYEYASDYNLSHQEIADRESGRFVPNQMPLYRILLSHGVKMDKTFKHPDDEMLFLDALRNADNETFMKMISTSKNDYHYICLNSIKRNCQEDFFRCLPYTQEYNMGLYLAEAVKNNIPWAITFLIIKIKDKQDRNMTISDILNDAHNPDGIKILRDAVKMFPNFFTIAEMP